MRPTPATLAGATLLAGVLTGCFYGDEINQRPSADIRPRGDVAVFRKQTVVLDADKNDPEGQEVTLLWRVYSCTDATDQSTDCDQAPFDTNTLDELSFVVPSFRNDNVTPVRALRVLLDATDDLGATARPTQELIIPIDDAAPDLTLRQDSRHDFVVDSHVQLYVDVTDTDDDADTVVLAWRVETPDPNATFELTGLPAVTPDAGHQTEGMSLLPHQPGMWNVVVDATDPIGKVTEKQFTLVVGDDLPPCITAPSPIADDTEALPLLDATLFQVPIVIDDLDVYPPQLGDQDLGVATFSWSIKPPGATDFQPLATTSNSVPLDPDNYQPDDVVELRVEVRDRITRDFTGCGDAATCALDAGDATCLQRETWKVRVQ